MSYYDDRNNAYTELKKQVTIWLNDEKSRELDLNLLFFNISMEHKVGNFILTKLLNGFIMQLNELGTKVNFEQKRKILTKVQ